MRNLFLTVIASLAILGGFAGTARAATIADIVAASGGEFDNNRYDYDILLNAVIAADLVDPLADPDADLTAFAPNDMAFVRLARDFGYQGWDEAEAWDAIVAVLTDLGGGDPIPVLTDVLLYHVAPERISAVKFFFLSIFRIPIETLQGGTFQPYFFRLIDNEPDLRDPRLFFPINLRADNGYIHTISRVLIPVDLP